MTVTQLSAGISTRKVISLSNYQYKILYQQDWWRHTRKKEILHFLFIKMNEVFFSPYPPYMPYQSLSARAAFSLVQIFPFPKDVTGMNCFLPFSSQNNRFPYSLWVIREPSEISHSYENNEPGLKSESGLTLDNSTSPENLHHLFIIYAQ